MATNHCPFYNGWEKKKGMHLQQTVAQWKQYLQLYFVYHKKSTLKRPVKNYKSHVALFFNFVNGYFVLIQVDRII